MSYASQEAWIFSGTVRQNVLFGKEFNKERYEAVLKACNLTPDLAEWEHGDQSLVGERGIMLSGGQKARVSLARAVYAEADIYLLDDPLSAVDARVGRHLVHECIGKFLSGKTVILVTHQLQHLRQADRILFLNDGKAQFQGDFEDLLDNEVKFLQTHKQDKKEEEHSKPAEEKKNIVKESNESWANEKGGRLRKSKKKRLSGNVDSDKVLQSDQVKRVEKETKQEGAVTADTYLQYLKHSGSFLLLAAVLATNILTQAAYTCGDVFLNYFTSLDYQPLPNDTGTGGDRPSDSLGKADLQPQGGGRLDPVYLQNVAIYCSLAALLLLLDFGRTHLVMKAAVNSANNLHGSMFARVVRGRLKFFDQNPAGMAERFTHVPSFHLCCMTGD